ncbi:MAG: DUF2878 domain-containing protein [Planctomycetota bacterium]|jgi:hypothetical protein|nr:DUF2878 domain-containing protein [Planctomycetota bacterium]
MKKDFWINAILHQIGWWSCVGFQGWLGPLLMFGFISTHWVLHPNERRQDLLLASVALLLGGSVDLTLSSVGAVNYQGSFEWGGVPLWIFSLWVGFGFTLRLSNSWLCTTPQRSFLLGIIAGPAAYAGASRIDLIALPYGLQSLIWIGSLWGPVLGVLAKVRAWSEADDRKSDSNPRNPSDRSPR